MADAFHFELVSPERLLLSEDVHSVVVPGSDGQFEVLAHHAPLLSTLDPGVLEIAVANGETQRIFVRGGFADVTRSGLTILADEAIPIAQLDRAAIAAQIKDAEEDVADAEDPAARDEAERHLEHLRAVQAALGHS
jgi:F-type H+-transporting ATPase subunit epsilon